jgi:hypothetical protein
MSLFDELLGELTDVFISGLGIATAFLCLAGLGWLALEAFSRL